MFTADKIRKIKPTSTYESRLEKSVRKNIAANKRFLKRRIVKTQKENKNFYQFRVDVPDGFRTIDYRNAYINYYKNLGFDVETTDSIAYDMFYITLYW